MLPRRRGQDEDETSPVQRERPDGLCGNVCICDRGGGDWQICAFEGVDFLGGTLREESAAFCCL